MQADPSWDVDDPDYDRGWDDDWNEDEPALTPACRRQCDKCRAFVRHDRYCKTPGCDGYGVVCSLHPDDPHREWSFSE